MERDILSPNKHKLFFIVGAIGILATIINMLITDTGRVWDNFIFLKGGDLFMDFMNHVKYCEKPSEVYFVSKHACFPAFSYLFYYAINRLLPSDAITNFHSELTSPYAYLIYAVYIAVTVIILCALINKLLEKRGTKFTAALEIQLILSFAFVGGVIERGNSAIIVAEMLLAAMLLRDSEQKWKRELALWLVAFAAGFKIYPALFGILYLVEKRYKEAARLLVYGVAVFFLPFIFFGGFRGFVQFVKNQFAVQSETVSALSLKNILDKWFTAWGFSKALRIAAETAVFALALAAVVYCLIKSKKLHERALFIVALTVLFPTSSGSYTLCYFIIPLALFMRDESERNLYSFGLDITYGLIFTLVAYEKAFCENLPMQVSAVGCYLTILLVIISVMSEKTKKGIEAV